MKIHRKLKQRTAPIKGRRRTKAPIKKKLARGGAGTLLGLSILLAGLFDSPAQMIQQQTINNLNSNVAVEIMLPEEEPEKEQEYKEELSPSGKGFFRRLADRLRTWFLGLPQAVRACIGVPLWAAGCVIIHILSFLYSTVLSPVMVHILGFVLLALSLLAVFAVTMKAVFPNMPLKKILSRKNIFTVLAAALLLKITDMILPAFWTEYVRYKYILMLLAGLAALGMIFIPKLLRRRKSVISGRRVCDIVKSEY